MGNMLAVPTKPGKVQLNLWVSVDTDNALKDLASELHLRGRTQAAEVIIERYLATLKGAQGARTGKLHATTPRTKKSEGERKQG